MPAPTLENPGADRRHNLRMPVDFLQQHGRLVTRQGTLDVRILDVSAGGFGVELDGQALQFRHREADLELDGERIPVRICHVKQESGHAFIGLQRRDWSPTEEQIAIQRARLFDQHRSLVLQHYLSHRRTFPLLLAVIGTGIVVFFASGAWRPGYSGGWSIRRGSAASHPLSTRDRIAAEFSRSAVPAVLPTDTLREAAQSAAMTAPRTVRQTLVRLEQLAASRPSTVLRTSVTPILLHTDAAAFLQSFQTRHRQVLSEAALNEGLRNLTSRGDAVLNGPAQTSRLDLGDQTSLQVRWSRTSDGIVIEDVSEAADSVE